MTDFTRNIDAFNASTPADHAVSVTPNDGADLATIPTKAIYVGVAGNLTVDMADTGTNVTFKNVPIGIFPIRVDRVYATGSAGGAGDYIALY
jgi:hypothetical protein